MASGRTTGFLRGEFPYYRLGDGDRTLVVLPGLSDAFQGPAPDDRYAWLLSRYYYRGYTGAFTVYVVGRPRRLPAGHSTREMARGVVRAVEALDPPVDLSGLSLGGLVAQHVAADRPDLLGRLVLGVAGCRLGPAGRDLARRWRDWAAAGLWREVVRDSVPASYTGVRRWLYPPLLRLFGRALPEPAAVSDVVVSCQAALDHDAADRLAGVAVPTLVAGGTADPFFPVEVLEETAGAIPEARLELFEGGGHGVFEERRRAFDARVKDFLDGADG